MENDVNNSPDSAADSDSSSAQVGAESTKKTSLSASDILDSKGVPLENRLNEMFRKVNRFSEQVSKIDDIWASIVNNKSQQTLAEKAGIATGDYDSEDVPVEVRVEKVLERKMREKTLSELRQEHLKQFEEMKKIYPELDKDSDSYDPDFYREADRLYQKAFIDEPTGAKDAVQTAAVKTGRIQRLAEQALLKDEARRSRKIAEGGSDTRAKKASAGDDSDDATVKRSISKFNIDPKYYKKAKQNLGGNN
jgi:hypothetical protein